MTIWNSASKLDIHEEERGPRDEVAKGFVVDLLLLCTTQGSALQQDGAGAKKLFHHALDPAGKPGEICRYWFEAERTKHAVGGPQTETREEKEGWVGSTLPKRSRQYPESHTPQ